MTEPEPQPRQTLSFVRQMLNERRIKPKNKLGQNFLIDLNLLDFIVTSAEMTRDDLILEVGTGTGGLTHRLCAEAGWVVSVEIDRDFHELAQETLVRFPNLTLIHADILKGKNDLNPEVLSVIDREMKARNCTRLKLIANLPYAVATPVIANLLLTELPIERMVVMVQWEIAERFSAQPSTKDYASLAVLVQSLADVTVLKKLPPAVFWPRPLVHSGIVQIVPRAEKRAAVGDVVRFRHFLRDLYVHRRKNLRGALLAMPSSDLEKADVDAKLAELGIEGTVRAETLDLTDHLRLCRVFGGGSSS